MSANPKANPITDMVTYEPAENRLPLWARSTNPIVRRHLGMYWRTVPPDPQSFVMIMLAWSVLIGIGIFVPEIFGLTMITFIASILVVPLALVYYGYILFKIAVQSARTMQAEMKNNTLQLLRATPMSLPQIFLGKVAAAIWKHMDDLVMLAQVVLVFSPPLFFAAAPGVSAGYSDIWAIEQYPAVAPLLTLVGTAAMALRVFLEPLMVGVMSIFIGIVVPGRSRAISTAVLLSGFYFLLMYLLAHLPAVRGYTLADGTLVPPNTVWVVLLDIVLPLLLPVLFILVLLKLATMIVSD